VRLGAGAGTREAGDPWTIAGYLGKQDDFVAATGKFGLASADQAERDCAALGEAARASTIEAQPER
jgi:hypothetical protein